MQLNAADAPDTRLRSLHPGVLTLLHAADVCNYQLNAADTLAAPDPRSLLRAAADSCNYQLNAADAPDTRLHSRRRTRARRSAPPRTAATTS